MTNRIHILSDHTINKIAAGEVIENPASVVKELVENAIDAGSTEISIEIQGGGRQLIRVVDNGSGMGHDDALLSLERHATSKIREVDQILGVTTMGFRGEAIPSIAAISKFTLITCPVGAEQGTMILVEGGKICKAVSAVRSPGTTIEVKSLFYNVPVRRKFQRSPSYDQTEIRKMLIRLALANPSITFRLVAGNTTLLQTRSVSDVSHLEQLRLRAIDCLGREFVDRCVAIEHSSEAVQMIGLLGKPEACHSHRTGQHLYINGRAVFVPTIARAIAESYGTALPARRHPIFLLQLTLPGDTVDVNVHPQKREIRLRHGVMVEKALIEAGRATLQLYSSPCNTPTSFLAEAADSDEEEIPISLRPPEFPEPQRSYPSSSAPSFSSFTATESDKQQKTHSSPSPLYPLHPPTDQQKSFPKNLSSPFPKPTSPAIQSTLPLIRSHSPPKLISCAPGYLLCTGEAASIFGLEAQQPPWILVDQRRAHIRILYDTLKKEQTTVTQPLLLPQTLTLSRDMITLLQEHQELIKQIGIEISVLGPDTLLIDQVASLFQKQNLKLLLEEIAEEIARSGSTRAEERAEERQRVRLASKAAIAKQSLLSTEEGQQLLNALVNSSNPVRCPSGTSIVHPVYPEKLCL